MTTVVAVAGLGAYFAVVGLDAADKAASVIGGLAAVVGLALAGYGLFGWSGRPDVSQRAQASDRGSSVTQIGGHQHTGASGPAPRTPGRVEQHGTASEGGNVTQIGGDQHLGPASRP